MMTLFLVREQDSSFSNSYDDALLKIRENTTASIVIGFSAVMIVLMGVKF